MAGLTASTKTATGWVLLLGSMGMMFGLVSVDLMTLKDWSQMQTPIFLGTTLGHLAVVITAFVGGKIIPEHREWQRTRASDQQVQL